MGQRQSATDQARNAKRSYYEVLGIAKDASDGEIKRAYRNKALEFHPDRNFGNIEEATVLFAEVQAAYEVLSDSQERAWYDSHEAALLAGDDVSEDFGDSIPVTTSADIAKLYAGFGGRIDYSDSSDGFFTTLREVFERLSQEEDAAINMGGGESVFYPSFGTAEDDCADVVRPFYDVWSGFSTQKSFAWKDIYRLSDAPDRRVRRAMEKENKRLRDDAIREFNATVRALVAFVKKRDPRQKANVQTGEERHGILRNVAAMQAAKARAANQVRVEAEVLPRWVTMQHADDQEAEYVWDEDDEEPEEHFECIVCEKIFKTEKQYEAHERSKKHVQAVKKIKRQMRKEGVGFGLDLDGDRHEHGSREVKEPETTMQELDCHTPSTFSPTQQGDEDRSQIYSNASPQRQPLSLLECSSSDSVRSAEIPRIYGDSGGDDCASRDVVSKRLAGLKNSKLDFDTDSNIGSRKTKGKAKQKRTKRAAKEEHHAESGRRCITCSMVFSSKNQLFDHLKQVPSHAQCMAKEMEDVDGAQGKIQGGSHK